MRDGINTVFLSEVRGEKRMSRLDSWVFLCGVNQEPEADIIIGLLNEEGISASKDFPEAGQFLKVAYGLTSGVDIYVPEKEIEKAKELLEKSIQGLEKHEEEELELEDNGDNNVEETNSKPSLNKKKFPWSLIIVILLIVFGSVIVFQHVSFF